MASSVAAQQAEAQKKAAKAAKDKGKTVADGDKKSSSTAVSSGVTPERADRWAAELGPPSAQPKRQQNGPLSPSGKASTAPGGGFLHVPGGAGKRGMTGPRQRKKDGSGAKEDEVDGAYVDIPDSKCFR